MSEDRLAKLEERDRAMREARDEILRRVAAWLRGQGFVQAGAGHFTRATPAQTCHIGFQKLRGGRNVRVMCSISGVETNSDSAVGPQNDSYGGRDSPNGRSYRFGWSTREPDMARTTAEYCRYIEEVVFEWFDGRLGEEIGN